MRSIDTAVLDFKRLDLLARAEGPLQHLDGRAKLLTSLVFIVTVVSLPRYEVAALLPFFIYPVVMVALGNLPAGFIARQVALVVPLALVVGMFNPLFDRAPQLVVGDFALSGGLLSWVSIVLRSLLTVAAAVTLVALTGFPGVCQALQRLGAPQLFTVQLLFLYRYIFVLAEEAARISRARELRSFGRRGRSMASFASLAGNLLLRTWMRAERIHMAMLARGFAGEFHTRQPGRFGGREIGFVAGWSLLFLALRNVNLTRSLGRLLTGMLP